MSAPDRVGGPGAWSRVRAMPRWARTVAWVVAWPVLLALWVTSRSTLRTGGRVGTAVLALLGLAGWIGVGVALLVVAVPDEAFEPTDGPPVDATEPSGVPHPAAPVEGLLEVHFLDVGMADATLLRHDEVAILVDAGHWEERDMVPRLRELGVDALDLVVITHPHADHLGQFDEVMDAFDVGEVWWSGSTTTTATFDRSLRALERSDAVYAEPRAGVVTTHGPLTVEVLHPDAGADLDDLRYANLALRVRFGDVRIVLTGDAERTAEARMVADQDPSGDVLKLGHHGSSTSTTPDFFRAVGPQVTVYSAGAHNDYGYPHEETVALVDAASVPIYGTDVHGSVTVTTDGTAIEVATERDGVVQSPRALERGERRTRADRRGAARGRAHPPGTRSRAASTSRLVKWGPKKIASTR